MNSLRLIAAILAFVLCTPFAGAQDSAATQVKGVVTDEAGTPIPLAHVYWLGTMVFTTTEQDGSFVLKTSPQSHDLVVDFVGFAADTLSVTDYNTPLAISLKPIEMGTVEVTARLKGRSKPTISVENTEVISANELIRAACCNLGESFSTNPSVDVSTTDAASGTQQIKLLGLSGKYVQMLTENIPNFRGIAAPYALGYVPGSWIQSIQISKGAASVKNGFESMTGQINLEYKKPQGERYLSAEAFVDDMFMVSADVIGNYTFKNSGWSTALLTHFDDLTLTSDANEDTFTDFPRARQYNVMNRWSYFSDKWIFQGVLHYLNDHKTAGQLDKTDPQGDPLPEPRYLIDLSTNRAEAFAKTALITNAETATSFALILDASYQDLRSAYGVYNFLNAAQWYGYASLLFESAPSEQHQISTGLSLVADVINAQWVIPGKQAGQDNLSGSTTTAQTEYYTLLTPGLYAQYTYTPVPQLVLMAGVRVDYDRLRGVFITPRAHIKYQPLQDLSLRASVGKGYRTHHALLENSYLLASSRVWNLPNEYLHVGEESWNAGLSSGWTTHFSEDQSLTLGAEYYYTHFTQRLLMDLDRPQEIAFYPSNGAPAYSHAVQLEVSSTPVRNLDLMLAFRYTDVRYTLNRPTGQELTEEPLTPRYKGLFTASYKTPLEKWQFDATLSLIGDGRLPLSYIPQGEETPLWPERYGLYPGLDLQITRFFRWGSIYLGGTNLTNYTQPTPIIGADAPFGKTFDATMVWGPTGGYGYYAGVTVDVF